MLTRRLLVSAILALMCPARLAAAEDESDLNRLVRPYSTQRIIDLDIGEACTFTLKGGAARMIRLVSVAERRDSVVNLVRRADVRLEIDGRPLDLTCAPYVMPTESAGARLLVDSTSAWGNTPKRIQLSAWDAGDPIVDVKRFGFPLRDFAFLSQGTQAYNEPVHLGAGDDDPGGQSFYHDYGFDNAGFEGREPVLSAVEGTVARFWPSREQVCSILIEDSAGTLWEHEHLDSIEPGIVLNTRVTPGQKLGILGRTGPSGNFSHLHLGTFRSREDHDAGRPNRRLNLYPWLVAAYRAQHPTALLAVARPHCIARTGETIPLDGSNSLAPLGRRIVQWRWVLPDGRVLRQAKTDVRFDRPGAYVAELWVRDDQGVQDVDFCQIKIFSKAMPEKTMPHIFMTVTPTQGVRANQPVTFRGWPQGEGAGPISIDFDDGARVAEYEPYAPVNHAFKTPGIHIITARCQAAGRPVTAKLKVVCGP